MVSSELVNPKVNFKMDSFIVVADVVAIPFIETANMVEERVVDKMVSVEAVTVVVVIVARDALLRNKVLKLKLEVISERVEIGGV